MRPTQERKKELKMPHAHWTFMVFMAANNDLSGFAGDNLKAIEQVGSTDAVKILVFVKQQKTDGASPKALRLQIAPRGTAPVVQDLGDIDSGDPQVLSDFIGWCVQTAPADHYALILWSHGAGWSPADMEQLYKAVRGNSGDVSRGELNYLANKGFARAVFSSTLKRILSASGTDRAILVDDGTSHSLDTLELGNVLKAASATVGHKLDLLGMDACLMSELEVSYEVADYVNTIVASEEVEPGAGWRYEDVLGFLTAHAETPPIDVAKYIVNSYITYYKTVPNSWPVTQSAVDLTKIAQFATTIDKLAAALRSDIKNTWPVIQKAQLRSIRFENRLVDILTFCSNLIGLSSNEAIKSTARDVTEALRPGGFLITEGHLGPSIKDSGGISCYFPTPGEGVSKYYGQLQFAKAHKWDGFLNEYQTAASS